MINVNGQNNVWLINVNISLQKECVSDIHQMLNVFGMVKFVLRNNVNMLINNIKPIKIVNNLFLIVLQMVKDV